MIKFKIAGHYLILMAMSFALNQALNQAFAQTVTLKNYEQPGEIPASESSASENSQEGLNPVQSKRQRLLARLANMETFENAKAADFPKELESIGKEISLYAESRKKECTGEYSSIEITENGETKKLKNKLSKEEKKLCLLELIKLRQSFANSMFNIRKKMLLMQHQSQLENLEAVRGETLRELEVMAGKLK